MKNPIEWKLVHRSVTELKLGLTLRKVDFSWRPYRDRSEVARADYDRLREDIAKRGILKPIITWRGHVLIGMRRVEIARELGIPVVEAAEIIEDITEWTRDDEMNRLAKMRADIGAADY